MKKVLILLFFILIIISSFLIKIYFSKKHILTHRPKIGAVEIRNRCLYDGSSEGYIDSSNYADNVNEDNNTLQNLLNITGGFDSNYYTELDKSMIDSVINNSDNISFNLCNTTHSNVRSKLELDDTVNIASCIKHGRKEKIKKKVTFNEGSVIHNWYEYDTWESLKNNKSHWKQYLDDRICGRKHFKFNWDEILKTVMPLVNNETVEYMGVIRARDDKKTLYVHSLESSKNDTTTSNTYVRSVPAEIVAKHKEIPGYFLFHTHPAKISDPFPSDGDIYFALHDNIDKHFLGQIVIGAYGIIIYYLPDKRFDEIMMQGDMLAFYTFCYDVIMSWNSINSMGRIKLRDKIKIIEKFGVNMIIIPSSDYISDNYFKHLVPNILFDRFIESKHELLDQIKSRVRYYEKKEKAISCKHK
jgi:hypothetical protein